MEGVGGQTMAELNSNTTIGILNVNGLNIPIKTDGRDGLKIWPTCCQQETHFKCNNIGRLKAEGWKRYIMQLLIKGNSNYINIG